MLPRLGVWVWEGLPAERAAAPQRCAACCRCSRCRAGPPALPLTPHAARLPPVAQAGAGGEESPRRLRQRDALGGDLFCSLVAAVNFQLPSESLRAVREGRAAHVRGSITSNNQPHQSPRGASSSVLPCSGCRGAHGEATASRPRLCHHMQPSRPSLYNRLWHPRPRFCERRPRWLPPSTAVSSTQPPVFPFNHSCQQTQAGIHGHVFVNGGSMVGLAGGGRPFQQAWHEFATTFRWSVVRGPAAAATAAAATAAAAAAAAAVLVPLPPPLCCHRCAAALPLPVCFCCCRCRCRCRCSLRVLLACCSLLLTRAVWIFPAHLPPSSLLPRSTDTGRRHCVAHHNRPPRVERMPGAGQAALRPAAHRPAVRLCAARVVTCRMDARAAFALVDSMTAGCAVRHAAAGGPAHGARQWRHQPAAVDGC